MNKFKIRLLKKRGLAECFIYAKYGDDENKVNSLLKEKRNEVAIEHQYKGVKFLICYTLDDFGWVIQVEFVQLSKKYLQYFHNHEPEIERRIVKNDFITDFSMERLVYDSSLFNFPFLFNFSLTSDKILLEACSNLVIQQIDYANSYYDYESWVNSF